MKYTVSWSPEALQELAHIWVIASDKQAISSASRQIDQILEIAPFEFGESRQEQHIRVLFDGPLGIEYDVDERIAK